MDTLVKIKAKQLRSQGKTYTEINRLLGFNIPKSTLVYWCKEIQMPVNYKQRIRKINLKNLEKARKLAVAANKEKQKRLINGLIAKNKNLKIYINNDVCKLLLSILYLGEGAKYKGTRALRLGSSSPVIIRLYLKLLKKSFEIKSEKFRVTVQCRADQDIESLEKFWGSITKISKNQFYKTRIDKRTIGKKTLKKDYMGVCVINYHDTKVQLELELLSEQIEKWLQ